MIPNQPKITPELVVSHGLEPDDYTRIHKGGVLSWAGPT